jgi:segregation and condensation protein A
MEADVIEEDSDLAVIEADASSCETEKQHKSEIKVNGEVVQQLPVDLYIPPDALSVILETFEGPLDLLLYLIRKQNLDILNIPIAAITRQYMQYVEMMKTLRLELAAEYLVMAAILAEVKSRMLLPRQAEEGAEEEDPRAELIRRLQEYERFREVAEKIDELPRHGRDIFNGQAALPQIEKQPAPPKVDLQDIVLAFLDILKRSEILSSHKVESEPLSVRERMSKVLDMLNEKRFIPFMDCFEPEEGRSGLVVSFLAILELLKLHLIDIVQSEPFAPIHLKIAQDGGDDGQPSDSD